MKTTIIYFGILATMFVNTTVANGIAKEDQNLDQVALESNLDVTNVTIGITLKKQEVTSEVNFTALSTNPTKSIEEVIEEDKKITEFQDEAYQTLVDESAIEVVIKEDNQIIENTLTNEVYPLDFELIKKYENALKSEAFKNVAFDKTNLKS